MSLKTSQLLLSNVNLKMVYVTVPAMDKAETVAQKIVSSKVAACVNIVPQITSIYTWEGKVEKVQECLMLIKTKNERLNELSKMIRELHPYDVPEIVAVEISAGNEDYVNWVKENTN